VRRAYVGIAGGSRPLPPRATARLGRETAIEVVEVVSGSPADRAGLRPEDLIVAVDGVAIEDVTDLQRLMDAERIARPVAFELLRGDRTLTVELRPIELQG
jgi:S1-C subfamily serine protease